MGDDASNTCSTPSNISICLQRRWSLHVQLFYSIPAVVVFRGCLFRERPLSRTAVLTKAIMTPATSPRRRSSLSIARRLPENQHDSQTFGVQMSIEETNYLFGVHEEQPKHKFVLLFRDGSAAVHSVDVDAADVITSAAVQIVGTSTGVSSSSDGGVSSDPDDSSDGGVYQVSVARARELVGNYFASKKG